MAMAHLEGSVREELPAVRLEDYFTPGELKLISAFLDLCESGTIGHFEAIVLVEGIERGDEAV